MFYGEQQLTNFRVDHATALCPLKDPELVEALQLQVHPSDASIHSVVLDLRKGSLIRQLLDQLPVCRLFVPSAAPRLDACFLELAEQGRDWSLPTLYFRKNGLHRLWNGGWAMVCGDEVLCDYDGFSPVITPALSSLHLAWDPQPSENEAIECQIRQMEANAQTVQIAFGFTLLSSLRSEIMRRGFSSDAFTIVSRKKIKSSKDCVVEDSALCIRTSALKDYLAQTPYGVMSRTAIGDRPEQEGVLPPIRAAKEVRRAKKKIHGKCYLEIPLNLLSSTAQRY